MAVSPSSHPSRGARQCPPLLWPPPWPPPAAKRPKSSVSPKLQTAHSAIVVVNTPAQLEQQQSFARSGARTVGAVGNAGALRGLAVAVRVVLSATTTLPCQRRVQSRRQSEIVSALSHVVLVEVVLRDARDSGRHADPEDPLLVCVPLVVGGGAMLDVHPVHHVVRALEHKVLPVRTIIAGTLWKNATQMPAIIARLTASRSSCARGSCRR